MSLLENKVAFVSGGGSGIGFEIAKLFSQNDNYVIITGRSEERLLKAASSLSDNPSNAINLPL